MLNLKRSLTIILGAALLSACGGGGGGSSAPEPVPTPAPTPAPTSTASLSIESELVPFEGNVTLTWSSTNATSCTAGGDWEGSKATAGEETFQTPRMGILEFSIECSNSSSSALSNVKGVGMVNFENFYFEQKGEVFTFNTGNNAAVDYGLPQRIQPVDLNMDGIDDLVMFPTGFWEGEDLPVRAFIYENNNWAEKEDIFTQTIVSGVNFNPLIGDFNGDGWNDFIVPDQGKEVGNEGTGTPAEEIDFQYGKRIYLLSNGDGTYSPAFDNLPDNRKVFNHNAGIGDIDGDGLDDLIFSVIGDENPPTDELGSILFTTAVAYLNNGDGTFRIPDPIGQLPYRENEFYLVPGGGNIIDINNDGRGEVILHGSGSADNSILYPTGADSQVIKIFEYDESEGFQEIASLDQSPSMNEQCTEWLATRIIEVDLDGDQFRDFAAGWEWLGVQECPGDIYWDFHQNNGDGTFTNVTADTTLTKHQVDESFETIYFISNDINGDGTMDLANQTNGNLRLMSEWENDFILVKSDEDDQPTYTPGNVIVNESESLADVVSSSDLGSINNGQFWPVWLNLNQDNQLDFMIVKSHDWENGDPGEARNVDISAIKFLSDPKFTIRHVRVVSTDDGNKYEICSMDYVKNGDKACELTPSLTLRRDRTYVFTMTTSNYEAHPFTFSTTKDGTHGGGESYTSRVYTDNDDELDSIVAITIPSDAPDQLYYYCGTHAGMANEAVLNIID